MVSRTASSLLGWARKKAAPVLAGGPARHPYADQPDRAFWKHAVTGRTGETLTELAPTVEGLATAKVATAGSCFAQHIGRALKARGAHFMMCEPRPRLMGEKRGARFGYDLFSCRYGNIYTTRQLVQLFDEAFGTRTPAEQVWEKDGRYYDALRPSVQQNGFGSVEELQALRAAHLARVRDMFERLDLFVFTLGLTETWASRLDGTAFPTAPGVIAGSYDPARHAFLNLTYPDVYGDLDAMRTRLHKVNPGARMLLTVSPVPLAATATDQHVLVATTHSKAVLRAAAGAFAEAHDDVIYFPSYEVITGQPTRHAFYGDDLRSVRPEGVDAVMTHLFDEATQADLAAIEQPAPEPAEDDDDLGYEQCDESLLSEVSRNAR